MQRQLYTTGKQKEPDMKETNYYVIKKKAVPEVLLKVLEVQKLLDSKRAVSVLEATEKVGISRSSYYKYKDDIFPFYAGKKGRSITFVIEVDDQPGVMASILNIFALYKANILTIHQSIPINGKGLLTVSVDIEDSETDVSAMIQDVEKIEDVSYVKIIVLGDGMADEPIEAAGGKTPLQLADKPVMDEMAKVSEQGIAYTVPSNLPAGSDVANLSMLGYDPQVYYSGRSPLEALSIGVDMKDTDIALRCNVVTVSEDEDYEDKTIIDHSAGEITSEEAAILIEAVRKELEDDEYKFIRESATAI